MNLGIRAVVFAVALSSSAMASEWSRFRGPNGTGVDPSESALPVRFGPGENVLWKTELPPGHSSPILTDDRLFLTAFEDDNLLTFCLDRKTGEILWRREAPRARVTKVDDRNNAASPSPAFAHVMAALGGVEDADLVLLLAHHGRRGGGFRHRDGSWSPANRSQGNEPSPTQGRRAPASPRFSI